MPSATTPSHRQLVAGCTNMVTSPYCITMMNGTAIEVLFGEATAEQLLKCYVLAGSAWGSYLDENEIIGREKYLSTHPLAREGGCRTWCLYSQDDPTQVLSTCKTIRRSFLLSDTEDVDEIKGHCIASVVTALLYRGHGLASYLLQNVAQWLDGHGEAAASLLYSGIPDFYENLGWAALSNTGTSLSVDPWLQNVQEAYTKLEVRFLNDADVDELCAQDVDMLRAEAERAKVTTEGYRLTILPTTDLVRHQHAFADYMGYLWHGEAPEKRGAAYYNQAWLYWYHDFRGRCLYIQRIRSPIQEEENQIDIIAALLLGAIREAKEWNFTSVVTWDTSSDVRNALEMLARASVFTKSVGERRRAQRISIRWRNGEMKTACTVMSNEAYAWNSRN